MTRKYKGSVKRGSSLRAVKISIRHLPPSITEEELVTHFKGYLNPGTYQFYSSDEFKLSTDAFSYCSASFKNNEIAMEFAKKFDGKPIKSSKGVSTNISIEIATNEKNAFKKIPPTKDTPSVLTQKLKESKVYVDYFNEEDKQTFVPDFTKMLQEIEEQETRRIFGDLRETPLTKEVGVIYLTKEERGGMKIPKDKKERERRIQERKEKKQEKKLLRSSKKDKVKPSDLGGSPLVIINSQYRSSEGSSINSPGIRVESKLGNRSPGIILAKRNTDNGINITSKTVDIRDKKTNDKNRETGEKRDKNKKNRKDKVLEKKKRPKGNGKDDEDDYSTITFASKKKENDVQEKQKSDSCGTEDDNNSGKPKRHGYVPGMVAKRIFENN
uniref:Smg4_UPF3 domain-containing protein n=1 Tax=Strongyloides venezuelensis TaxID=75913 RepID=A0A0K0EUH9_STRVS